MADGMLGVDMLPGMGIIVMATPAIILAFVMGVAYAEDVLVDLLADALAVKISDVVSAIDAVDMLADENANDLTAVVTPLEFTLSSPREEPMPFC